MNFTDWNFSTHKVSWIDERLPMFVWRWASKIAGSCQCSPRYTLRHNGEITVGQHQHFSARHVWSWLRHISFLLPHRGLAILGTGQLALSLCCPHSSWDVQQAWTCWGPPAHWQEVAHGGHLPLTSQPYKRLWGNVWGCLFLSFTSSKCLSAVNEDGPGSSSSRYLKIYHLSK